MKKRTVSIKRTVWEIFLMTLLNIWYDPYGMQHLELKGLKGSENGSLGSLEKHINILGSSLDLSLKSDS